MSENSHADQDIGKVSPQDFSEAKISYPPEPDPATVPPAIKLDLMTKKESELLGCACCFLIVGIWLLVITYEGCKSKSGVRTMNPIPQLAVIAWPVLFASIYYWLTFFLTSEYFILVPRDKTLINYCRSYGQSTSTVFAKQEDCYATGVSGERKTHKGNVWWEYKVVLIKTDGKMTDLTDAKRDATGYTEMRDKAMGIAGILQCGFIEGGEKINLSSNLRTDGKISVTCKDVSQA